MKASLLFIFILMTSLVNAQITITNDYFPAEGDTLRTAFDGMPANINITAPGGNQTWNFNSLQGISTEVIVQPAIAGLNNENFTEAELMIPVGGQNSPAETYINVTPNVYEIVGYAGQDPAGFGIEVVVPYSPTLIERRAPLNFFDVNNADFAFTVAFSTEFLPPELIDSLGLDFLPDSLRVKVISDRLDIVDAWGELTIPGGTYEVLREKRTEMRKTQLEAKLEIGPISNWIDITTFVPFLDQIGSDTITTYHFFSNTAKEPIAVVTVTNDDMETPLFVSYKDNNILSNVNYVNTGKSDLIVYPNPAILEARFDFVNLNPGLYSLKIYNILGVEIWKNRYNINGNRTIKIDLDEFRKGTYLYSLIDERGKTLTTKRLMIVRP